MKITNEKLAEFIKNAKVNRKTGVEYSGKFEDRCKNSKVGKAISKMTDDEVEMFYKIVTSDRGTLRSALTSYFKVLGIRRDLSQFLCVNECINRKILKVD